MKQLTKTIIVIFAVIAAFAVIMVLAAVGYRFLSDTYSEKTETERLSPSKTVSVTDSKKNAMSSSVTTDNDKVKNTARDFTVYDVNGASVKVSDFFGKPIIVNFWATWCPPCRNELPAFNRMAEKYRDSVVFMMVDLTDGYRETADKTKEFLLQNGYTFPVYFDNDESAATAYSVYSIPVTVMIDRDGNEYTAKIGAMSEDALERYIKTLIGE